MVMPLFDYFLREDSKKHFTMKKLYEKALCDDYQCTLKSDFEHTTIYYHNCIYGNECNLFLANDQTHNQYYAHNHVPVKLEKVMVPDRKQLVSNYPNAKWNTIINDKQVVVEAPCPLGKECKEPDCILRHPCVFGSRCKDIYNVEHLVNKIHRCLFDDKPGGCKRKDDEEHRGLLQHVCVSSPCKNESDLHRVRFIHRCHHGDNCTKLPDDNHTMLNLHDCKDLSECQIAIDGKLSRTYHCDRFYHGPIIDKRKFMAN
jgi:hypothetical protein